MRTEYNIVAKARLYLSTTQGNGVFGTGKGELLATVERCGSLRKASIELGRSYRQVWGDINKAEKYLGFPLVQRSRGGRLGGKMILTQQGARFLRAWERHYKYVSNAVEVSYKKYISDIINQSKGDK
jgi:molybdate transport system regulatory protein